jgi:hypothetical protein
MLSDRFIGGGGPSITQFVLSAELSRGATLTRFSIRSTARESRLMKDAVDHSLKFSNVAGSAGVRKLLARNNSISCEHKTFDVLNFLCA